MDIPIIIGAMNGQKQFMIKLTIKIVINATRELNDSN